MIINISLIFGCSVIATLLLGQIFIRKKTSSNIILILLLFACGFWSVHATLYVMGVGDWFPHFNKTCMPFIATAGPMLYLYNRCLFDDYHIHQRTLIHALPFALCFLLATPFYFESAQFKIDYKETYLFSTSTIMVYIGTRISEISAICYILMTIILLNKVKTKTKSPEYKEDTENMRHLMMKVSSLSLFAAICRSIGAMLDKPVFSAIIPSLIIVGGFIALYITSQRNPKILALHFQACNAMKTNRKVDSTLLKKYKQIIIQRKLFLIPDLTILKLAKELNVQPHLLSELINATTHSNFKRFINSFRVKYAKQILRKYPQKKIIDVAYQSGFNSKSVFYEHFTQLTGLTPSQYKKEDKPEGQSHSHYSFTV